MDDKATKVKRCETCGQPMPQNETEEQYSDRMGHLIHESALRDPPTQKINPADPRTVQRDWPDDGSSEAHRYQCVECGHFFIGRKPHHFLVCKLCTDAAELNESTIRPETVERMHEQFTLGRRKNFSIEFRGKHLYVSSEGQTWRVLHESEISIEPDPRSREQAIRERCKVRDRLVNLLTAALRDEYQAGYEAATADQRSKP